MVLRNYDLAESRPLPASVHDFARWRDELASFEHLGLMWRRGPYNVVSEEGRAAPVDGAELTASVFTLLDGRPLLGRPLVEGDEAVGAPDVVVIGYDLWRSRLAGDPDVVGRTIRIGAAPHTVVGVMPPGFRYPVRDQLWLPVRFDSLVPESGNVGILMLARAATRARELAVRTALGASRTRIVAQLFIESLLLVAVAAGVGLVGLQVLATVPDHLVAGLPFWVDFEVAPRTALLAISLAAFSAVAAGVVPALKATGEGAQNSIRRAGAGGSGIEFGRGYGVLIVGEVAAALWLLAIGSTMAPAALTEPAGHSRGGLPARVPPASSGGRDARDAERCTGPTGDGRVGREGPGGAGPSALGRAGPRARRRRERPARHVARLPLRRGRRTAPGRRCAGARAFRAGRARRRGLSRGAGAAGRARSQLSTWAISARTGPP